MDYYFRGATLPTNFYMALITNAVAATVDTNTLGELTQISDGGYTTNGASLTPGATDFDVYTEGSSTAYVQIKDVQWTATTSIAPAQIVITDDNATPANRQIIAFGDATGTANAGQPYIVKNFQFNLNLNSGQFTDKGMYEILGYMFRATSAPSNLYIALIRASSAPSVSINTLSELTQISTGTGYSDGGYTMSRNGTDFDTLTENDTDDRAELQAKDVAWTASGGALDSGAGARYAVITNHHATVGSRNVLAWHDLSASQNVSDTYILTLQNLEWRVTI
jgi:hypothetical protein